MTTLEKQISLGGNLALFIIPASKIHSIADNSIYYTGTDPAVEIQCSSESIQHIIEKQHTRAGLLYNQTITGFLPGYSQQNNDMLNELSSYKPLVVVVRNANGDFLRMGSKTEGFILTHTYDTSKATSDRTGFSIKLSGSTTFAPAPVQSASTPL